MSTLPLTCSLTGNLVRERLQRWQQVYADAGVSRTAGPGVVEYRYWSSSEVLDELTGLVEAEHACCAHLGWGLRHDGAQVVVTITGQGGAADDGGHAARRRPLPPPDVDAGGRRGA